MIVTQRIRARDGHHGKQGTFWADKMRAYGTRIVGGTNPKRAGETHLERPSGQRPGCTKDTPNACAVMFIPPVGVKAAALDAIEAGIGKIVCLTEHVPCTTPCTCWLRRGSAGPR